MTLRSRFIICLSILSVCLLSCGRGTITDETRDLTWFHLKDRTQFRGELIGVIDDSVISEPENARSYRILHYSQIDAIVFQTTGPNKAVSSAVGTVAGSVLGGLAGMLGGMLVGVAIEFGYTPDGPQILFAEHGGYGAISAGATVGGILGIIGGGYAGYLMGSSDYSEEAILLHRQSDLEKLLPYSKFQQPDSVRRYRGY